MIPREHDRGRLDSRTDRHGTVDRIGVLLGAGLVGLTVTGTVLVSLLYLRVGQYVLAAALLVPPLITLGWYGAESYLRPERLVVEDRWK